MSFQVMEELSTFCTVLEPTHVETNNLHTIHYILLTNTSISPQFEIHSHNEKVKKLNITKVHHTPHVHITNQRYGKENYI